MTLSRSSYDWVREIKPDLKRLDSIPLTGTAPPFPWQELSTRLARAFERDGVNLQPGEMIWRAKESLYEGLGDHSFPLIFSVPPLQGQVCWVMPAQEVDILATLLLTKETHPLNLHDSALSESFYRFLALEVLYQLTQISFDKTLSPILTHQTTLPSQDSLCWDISLYIQGQTIWGRLIISSEFRHSWVEHFAQKQAVSLRSQQMSELVDVIVHIEAGKIHLFLAEWMTVQVGDFIPLDRCFLDPDRLEGRVMLSINGKHVFRAKLKNDTLKILELPLLHEVDNPMAKQSKDENEDDLSELNLSEEEDDLEDEDEDEDEEDEDDSDLFTESDEDDDLFTETDTDTDMDTETDTHTDVDTEEEKESEQEKEESLEKKAISPKKASSSTPHSVTDMNQKSIVPEQIPVVLTIEVGQVQMSMGQLLKLEPGNLLEIDMHPDNGVDLTVNGRIVGKGELIRIGEALGVRVLQLGR